MCVICFMILLFYCIPLVYENKTYIYIQSDIHTDYGHCVNQSIVNIQPTLICSHKIRYTKRSFALSYWWSINQCIHFNHMKKCQ